MKYFFVDNQLTYDGTQLSSLWAYKNFQIQGDSIISFAGPCYVPIENLVDQQDRLDGAFIKSDKMLHFIIEHFDMDLEKMILKQRLLVGLIKEVLENTKGVKIIRKGDDLFYGQKKLSVSIATISPVSALIHTGINILSTNTPVETSCLEDFGIKTDKDIREFSWQIGQKYMSELEGIYYARTKVNGVG